MVILKFISSSFSLSAEVVTFNVPRLHDHFVFDDFHFFMLVALIVAFIQSVHSFLQGACFMLLPLSSHHLYSYS
jgi:hypothetical protein